MLVEVGRIVVQLLDALLGNNTVVVGLAGQLKMSIQCKKLFTSITFIEFGVEAEIRNGRVKDDGPES